MARVQLSALINDISGKVGGSVFQRTQGGLCLRSNSGKIDSNSAQSNSKKVGMSTVQGGWQGLTDAERLLWQTYAVYLNKKQKHNTSLLLNGHQLFLNINCLRYDLSSSNSLFNPYLLSTPIFAPLPLPITVTIITTNFGDLTVTMDRSIDNTTEVVALYLSRPLSATQKSGYQKMILMKAQTATGFDFICTDYYISVYGRLPVAGEWLQLKLAIYSTVGENFSSHTVQRIQYS